MLVLLLLLSYYLFLAKDYSVLFENLRESDTSAVTAELDKQGIAYKLADDGHSVLVDRDAVASARVAVAAANVLAGGEVGFELFDDSDIGLSEFSQKMNYLRALQGELTRTIMAMEGVRFARVHLALPERSIFRNEQAHPSAAITVQTTDGRPLAPSRVQGLQQLVAASVTDLSPEQVVVLDDAGMTLSAAPSAMALGSGLTERAAFEQYSQIKASNAIEELMRGHPFELIVSARAGSAAMTSASENDAKTGSTSHMQIIVRTIDALPPADQNDISTRIVEDLALDLGAGDSVTFQTGVVRPRATPMASAAQPAIDWDRTSRERASEPASSFALPHGLLANRWLWLLTGLIAVVLWLVWRQRGSLSDDERQHFATVLSEELDAFRAERNE
ncbi:flagellar M-ring protein FliF [Sphingopyxis panaciterrae]|nr:flagellar M-ring protein FliF [Sphingopyxis panaciterrae]